MIDLGAGIPLVLIPGIQGRWEWMAPSVDALAREYRVIAASLPGEPGVDAEFDADADFDVFVRHLDDVLDASGVASAILCGVSFGGLIALRYAAVRSHRVRGLILVSTPGPRWRLNPSQARYARWPLFRVPCSWWAQLAADGESCGRCIPIHARACRPASEPGWRVARAPAAPRRMGRRAQLAERQNFEADCERVKVPTLVVTGEKDLDLVVPCEESMCYLDLIHGSSFQLFERTGHLGTVLAPDRFAAIVSRFCRAL